MSHAPPTPPPTSEAELQDEQRDKAPENATPIEQEPPQSTSTTTAETDTTESVQVDVPENEPPDIDVALEAFAVIASLALEQRYDEVIRIAENTDAKISASQPGNNRMLVVAPLVLCYLIKDNTPPASQALIRSSVTQDALGTELIALVKATSARDYQEVYNRSQSLLEQTQASTPEQKPLATVVAALIEAFRTTFRMRAFNLLSKAYSSLPLGLAQIYVDLPVDALLQATKSNGWSYDPSTQILAPKQIDPKNKRDPSISGLGAFNFVADSVSRLET